MLAVTCDIDVLCTASLHCSTWGGPLSLVFASLENKDGAQRASLLAVGLMHRNYWALYHLRISKIKICELLPFRDTFYRSRDVWLYILNLNLEPPLAEKSVPSIKGKAWQFSHDANRENLMTFWGTWRCFFFQMQTQQQHIPPLSEASLRATTSAWVAESSLRVVIDVVASAVGKARTQCERLYWSKHNKISIV